MPYPASLVVGAVGFIQKRSDCSAAVAFEGLVRACGPDDTSVPPSPVYDGPAWVPEDDANSTVSTRNAIDTMTVPR